MPKIPPSPVTRVHATMLRPTYAILAWTAPLVGTAPFHYEVRYAKHGSNSWFTGARTQSTTAYVGFLSPSTTYDIAVLASN